LEGDGDDQIAGYLLKGVVYVDDIAQTVNFRGRNKSTILFINRSIMCVVDGVATGYNLN